MGKARMGHAATGFNRVHHFQNQNLMCFILPDVLYLMKTSTFSLSCTGEPTEST
jgi:hypothetical protein